MSHTPYQVDLPHQLGAEEARRRIESGVGGLKDHVPGATAIRSSWSGDRLALDITAFGQEVNAGIDVRDTFVRVEMMLPPALAFFGKAIEAGLRRGGALLLEDGSKRA